MLDIYNVIIVGGGVVGSALAASLDLPNVCIIEKDWNYVDTMIGELLQPGGIATLEKLKLENCLEDIDACSTSGYSMLSEYGKVEVNFPENCSPKSAKCFEHGLFVSKLRERAFSKKDVHKIEGSVTNLLQSEDKSRVNGVIYNNGNGTPSKQVFAKLVIVANGCFSKIRPESLSKNLTLSSWYAGFLVENCKLPVEGRGNIAYGTKGNILMYRISPCAFRVLVCIDEPRISCEAFDEVLEIIHSCSEIIPNCILQKIVESAFKQQLKFLPNYQLPYNKPPGKGVIYAGDVLNIRHPIAGGGMTVGLNDVYILSRLLTRDLFTASDFTSLDAMANSYYKERALIANVINIFSNGLYNISRNVSKGHLILRNNFLKYEVQNANRDHHLYFMSGQCSCVLLLFKDLVPLFRYVFISTLLEGTNSLSPFSISSYTKIPLIFFSNFVSFLHLLFTCLTVLIPMILSELL